MCLFWMDHLYAFVQQYSKQAQSDNDHHTCEEERELGALDTTLRSVFDLIEN